MTGGAVWEYPIRQPRTKPRRAARSGARWATATVPASWRRSVRLPRRRAAGFSWPLNPTRGSIMAKFVALLLLEGPLTNSVRTEQSETEKTRELITAAMVAKGGKDRLLQFPAWHIKYRETFVRDGKKTVEVGEVYEHLSRGQARYQTGPEDFIIVNGKQGWINNGKNVTRSEEHTSELQSLRHL